MARIDPDALLPIGRIAERAGLSVSAVRFYDARGLIRAVRRGSRRWFPRHTLRRLAFIAAGQRVGLTLEELAEVLDRLPADRAPTQREWTRISRSWSGMVAARIRELEHLRGDLDSCIGCGCLSLGTCVLFNPDDEAQEEGPGARWVRGATATRLGER